MPATPRFLLILVGLVSCSFVPLVHAQQPASEPAPGVLAQLTPAETRAAGLSKLSASERTALDAALNRYLGVEVAKSTEKAVNKAVASHETVIESQVAGVFTGLSGHTRIHLANGQTWQQDNSTDKFSANIDSPDIIILRGGLGYVMRVGGINGKFYVSQVTGH